MKYDIICLLKSERTGDIMSAKTKKAPKSNRWAIIDQTFLSLMITCSIIELTNRGAGIVDGLLVSNFMDAKSA